MKPIVGFVLMVAGAVGLVFAVPAKVMPGAAVFQASGCTQCHGTTGQGTAKGPSLFGVGRRLQRDEIERQIREGGGAMPAFGEVLSVEDTEELGKYLETWKTPSKTRRTHAQ